MSTDIGQWVLNLIQNQGLATVLILGAGWFLARQVWPTIVETILPAWIDARKAETRLKERQVIAVERIADAVWSPTPFGPRGSSGPSCDPGSATPSSPK